MTQMDVDDRDIKKFNIKMKLVVIGIGKSHCNDNVSPLKCVNEKKMEAKPLFCTKICTFAIFMVFKSWRSITQNAFLQMT